MVFDERTVVRRMLGLCNCGGEVLADLDIDRDNAYDHLPLSMANPCVRRLSLIFHTLPTPSIAEPWSPVSDQ